jgi:hypothetical protein
MELEAVIPSLRPVRETFLEVVDIGEQTSVGSFVEAWEAPWLLVEAIRLYNPTARPRRFPPRPRG